VRVWQLRADPDRFRWLTMVRDGDFSVLSDLWDRPQAAAWVPLEVETIEEKPRDRTLPLADFPVLGSTPTFSKKAVDELLDLLVENGELLPLVFPGASYYVYNVTCTIDALDEAASDVKYFSSGRVMDVRRHVFRMNQVSAPIFKIPQLRGSVYVTDRFVDRVQAAGLTGFEFSDV
jgi:hypothetical protein